MGQVSKQRFSTKAQKKSELHRTHSISIFQPKISVSHIWEIDADTIKKQALKNLRKESLFQLVPIKNDGDSLLTFCDIHNKNQGALALIQKELLNNTKELLKESFYIFPVSLYDLMIMPVSLADTVDEMKRQLLESNDELPEEYILSNNIYYYGEKGQLEIIK